MWNIKINSSTRSIITEINLRSIEKGRYRHSSYGRLFKPTLSLSRRHGGHFFRGHRYKHWSWSSVNRAGYIAYMNTKLDVVVVDWHCARVNYPLRLSDVESKTPRLYARKLSLMIGRITSGGHHKTGTGGQFYYLRPASDRSGQTQCCFGNMLIKL